MVRNLPASGGDAGDIGLNRGSERSLGGGNGNPFQYSCLKNPMDRGACQRRQATVHEVTKESDMTEQLSMHTHVTLELGEPRKIT